ncbi:hypothetical protein ACFWP5_06935 [Streptomyces sp. NPDC058469]|uniref:hypothetical protein n=1 Tax=Streptomyces sp. NPDC058469 TaxID=3346514 RepID=UPI00366995C8
MKHSVPAPAVMRADAATEAAEIPLLPVLASCVGVPEVVPEIVPEDVVVVAGVVVAVGDVEGAVGVADVDGVADAVGVVVPEVAAFTIEHPEPPLRAPVGAPAERALRARKEAPENEPFLLAEIDW